MDMRGRTVVITGANSGLGLASAEALAQAGATLVLTSRTTDKGDGAVAAVLETVPGADVTAVSLDLADLSSLRSCAAELNARLSGVDVLLNNAGVMMPPYRQQTTDGFELQLGTNHLGHYAFTGLLLPLLLATPGSRVVTVSSVAARGGRIDFDDLMAERSYSPSSAYGASKLANLLFTLELQRRLGATGSSTIAVAAHPGVSSTNLMASMELPGLVTKALGLLMQSAKQGARPQVHAASAPDVTGGQYFGPKGPGEFRGRRVTHASFPPAALDAGSAATLWTRSADLTGVAYPFA